mgnify:CR=1 FL=1|jgi:D-beta-D-heptose 7-phosphate kinase/D-beta-D-heptose 1-phosphate adenosyltransferase|tara:strand:- start:8823 stop:9284 length:462 start_codon:yes stop_codon:yes gene_type:complete
MKPTPLYPNRVEELCLDHKVKILVNGAFDILHTGHIDLFMYAKSLGYVICALDSDERIRQNKGIDRPVNSLEVRAKILSRIVDINEIWTFNSDLELIYLMNRADMRVIGSDWKGKDIVGEGLIDIDFFGRVNDEATTNTLENYINRRNLLGHL